MAERATIDVAAPPGGWLPPWPNVAELEAVLPHEHWTLVGGLMTFAGSDRARINLLSRELPRHHAAWRTVAPNVREQGQAALSILAAPWRRRTVDGDGHACAVG